MRDPVGTSNVNKNQSRPWGNDLSYGRGRALIDNWHYVKMSCAFPTVFFQNLLLDVSNSVIFVLCGRFKPNTVKHETTLVTLLQAEVAED